MIILSQSWVIAESLGLSGIVIVDHGELFLVSEWPVGDLGRGIRVVEVAIVVHLGVLRVSSSDGLLSLVELTSGDNWGRQLVSILVILGLALVLIQVLLVELLESLLLLESSLVFLLLSLLLLQEGSSKSIGLLLVISDLGVDVLNDISLLSIGLLCGSSLHASSSIQSFSLFASSGNRNQDNNSNEYKEQSSYNILILYLILDVFIVTFRSMIRIVIRKRLIELSQIVLISRSVFSFPLFSIFRGMGVWGLGLRIVKSLSFRRLSVGKLFSWNHLPNYYFL